MSPAFVTPRMTSTVPMPLRSSAFHPTVSGTAAAGEAVGLGGSVGDGAAVAVVDELGAVADGAELGDAVASGVAQAARLSAIAARMSPDRVRIRLPLTTVPTGQA